VCELGGAFNAGKVLLIDSSEVLYGLRVASLCNGGHNLGGLLCAIDAIRENLLHQ
jgi:hypothetical protein